MNFYPKIGVVYIVRRKEGLKVFQTFLESLRKFDTNKTPFSLIFVYKGFANKYEALHWEAAAWGLKNHEKCSICIYDYGYDIRAYRVASKFFNKFDVMLFFNSFTRIISHNWLDRMVQAFCVYDLVGTSDSDYSFMSAKSGKFARWWRSFFFNPFPNYHIRTNGFMIKRNHFLKICPKITWFKKLCYLFESGKRGMTTKVNRCTVIRNLIVDNRTNPQYEKISMAHS